jgi:diguanylate cyclase
MSLSPSVSGAVANNYDALLVVAWKARWKQLPTCVLDLLAQLADSSTDDITEFFFASMLQDERAASFLVPAHAHDHLKPAMQRWLISLLSSTADSFELLIEENHQIGDIQARIDLPIDLLAKALRVLRERMHWHIDMAQQPAEVTQAAIGAVDYLLDISLETMTRAFLKAHDRVARNDAAYQLFSLFQNVGTERERQRALLLGWENRLLYAVASNEQHVANTASLSLSEFGLWFMHKAIPTFGENNETRRINQLISDIDALMGRVIDQELLRIIQERVGAIQGLLNLLFERIGELESGSDPLTHLLNRRFLPSVLRREIELARKKNGSFSVVSLDLDYFKNINDNHGHLVGDRVLQHIAMTLVQCTRSNDYLFRVGGEEFMLILIGVDESRALVIAERIRHRIANTPIPLFDTKSLNISASLGVASYDGHPDYQHLMVRADRAMYKAKLLGRNRVVLADSLSTLMTADTID